MSAFYKDGETKAMDSGCRGGGRNQRLTGRVETSDFIEGKIFCQHKTNKQNSLTTTIKENVTSPLMISALETLGLSFSFQCT